MASQKRGKGPYAERRLIARTGVGSKVIQGSRKLGWVRGSHINLSREVGHAWLEDYDREKTNGKNETEEMNRPQLPTRAPMSQCFPVWVFGTPAMRRESARCQRRSRTTLCVRSLSSSNEQQQQQQQRITAHPMRPPLCYGDQQRQMCLCVQQHSGKKPKQAEVEASTANPPGGRPGEL